MSSAKRERQKQARAERQLRRAVETERRRGMQEWLQRRRSFELSELDGFTAMMTTPLPQVRRKRRRR